MKKVDVIIYSRDRACQLDLLLRSIRDNFENVNTVVTMYDYSNEDFRLGYERVKSSKYDIKALYTRQTKETFRGILKFLVDTSKMDYILPLCDDDVFIRKTNLTRALHNMGDDIVGLNLRYSKDLSTSYHHGTKLPLPTLTWDTKDYITWDWTEYPHQGRWEYPYQAGAMVYQTEFLRHMIENIEFTLPNSFETAMMQKKNFWGRYKVMALPRASVVNVSINRVQEDVPNRGGRDINYSPEELNQKFLTNEYINTKGIYDKVFDCEFIEIPLNFIEGF